MTKMTPEEEDRLIYEVKKPPQQKVIDLWYTLPSEKRKNSFDVLDKRITRDR